MHTLQGSLPPPPACNIGWRRAERWGGAVEKDMPSGRWAVGSAGLRRGWKAAETRFFGLFGPLDVAGHQRGQESQRPWESHGQGPCLIRTHFAPPCRTKGICLTLESKPCLGCRCALVTEHKPNNACKVRGSTSTTGRMGEQVKTKKKKSVMSRTT